MCVVNEYAYIRVSSQEQNEERQLAAMKQFCIPKEHVYLDKQSGKDFNRPNYCALVESLREQLFLDNITQVTEWMDMSLNVISENTSII